MHFQNLVTARLEATKTKHSEKGASPDMAYQCTLATALHVYWYAPQNIQCMRLFGELLRVHRFLLDRKITLPPPSVMAHSSYLVSALAWPGGQPGRGRWLHDTNMQLSTFNVTLACHMCLGDLIGQRTGHLVVSPPDCHVLPMQKTVWPFSKDFYLY